MAAGPHPGSGVVPQFSGGVPYISAAPGSPGRRREAAFLRAGVSLARQDELPLPDLEPFRTVIMTPGMFTPRSFTANVLGVKLEGLKLTRRAACGVRIAWWLPAQPLSYSRELRPHPSQPPICRYPALTFWCISACQPVSSRRHAVHRRLSARRHLAGADDLAFAGRGTILIALNTVNKFAIVQPEGTHTIVLTSADGLSNPTSVAVAGDTVYIPSAAYLTQDDPNLLLARLTRQAWRPRVTARCAVRPCGCRRPA
jgi:hypothetical protein